MKILNHNLHRQRKSQPKNTYSFLAKTVFWLGVCQDCFHVGYVYVTADVICSYFVELWGTRRKRELQNEKFLPTNWNKLPPAKTADILISN